MGRILAIDYGLKRTGLAVTDELKIIASPLEMVNTHEIWKYLTHYFATNKVEKVLIGIPQNLNGQDTDTSKPVKFFIRKFKDVYPTIAIEGRDERFTSVSAQRNMIEAGFSKKDRQNKGNVDMISATIILQEYLNF